MEVFVAIIIQLFFLAFGKKNDKFSQNSREEEIRPFFLLDDFDNKNNNLHERSQDSDIDSNDGDDGDFEG